MVTYHDLSEGVLGCQHYVLPLQLSAPCCDVFYACRFCHDAEQAHVLDRKTVNRVWCARCKRIQSLVGDAATDSACTGCGSRFARYHCPECRFYDDAPDKSIFHCAECGVCRVGRREDFFHCAVCGVCMSLELRGNHRCVERCLESTCPICAEELRESIQPTTLLGCGHALHASCLGKYAERGKYGCPMCGKSMGDTSEIVRRLDEVVARCEREGLMPREFRNVKALVYCVDCERETTTRYHFLSHKCAACGSHNTKLVKKFV